MMLVVEPSAQGNAILKKYQDNLTEGQTCQLWYDAGDMGIITVFSEHDKLLEKDFFHRQRNAYLRRLLDLVWQ
jgi:hypothetical protein